MQWPSKLSPLKYCANSSQNIKLAVSLVYLQLSLASFLPSEQRWLPLCGPYHLVSPDSCLLLYPHLKHPLPSSRSTGLSQLLNRSAGFYLRAFAQTVHFACNPLHTHTHPSIPPSGFPCSIPTQGAALTLHARSGLCVLRSQRPVEVIVYSVLLFPARLKPQEVRDWLFCQPPYPQFLAQSWHQTDGRIHL